MHFKTCRFHCTSHIRIRYRYYTTCNLNVSMNYMYEAWICLFLDPSRQDFCMFNHVQHTTTSHTININIIREINPSDRATRYTKYKCIIDNAASILLLHYKSVLHRFFQSQPRGLQHGQPRLIPRWCPFGCPFGCPTLGFPKWDYLSLSNDSLSNNYEWLGYLAGVLFHSYVW